MNSTKIKIELDDTVKDNIFFHGINEIIINRNELFKYAVMLEEVPSYVKESDFEYLQSKIPDYESLMSDFIEFSNDYIKNLSNEDRKKNQISEIVGVAIGLKYCITLLDINPNLLKKIPPSNNGKYLDYSVNTINGEVEIETKGTIAQYSSEMKKDILAKKANKPNIYLRLGTITHLVGQNEDRKSKCIVIDDPPNNSIISKPNNIEILLLNYAMLLSYIIDSKYYNKFINPLLSKKIQKIRINQYKFFGSYILNGRQYLGECFDRRLIIDNINRLKDQANDRKKLFSLLTKNVGIVKYFIGIDSEIIKAIAKRDFDFLVKFNSKIIFQESPGTTQFLDRDGVLIIKSYNSNAQLEQIFPESEVENRLGLQLNFSDRKPHACGAPCRSKEIKGKPCEILTYREHCHFHR